MCNIWGVTIVSAGLTAPMQERLNEAGFSCYQGVYCRCCRATVPRVAQGYEHCEYE